MDTRAETSPPADSGAPSERPSDGAITVTRVDDQPATPRWLEGEQRNRRPLESFSIGRFRVLEKIGAGGMGVVFAAYDDELDRKVAVKLVLPDRDASPKEQRRLLEEARSMARLDHPNVATVFETGEHDGGVYVAMEFIRGVTLRQWLREHRELDAILDAYVQAGRGLESAHEAGMVHRDFKPDNVMVDGRGRARVLDFGLALRLAGGADQDDEPPPPSLPSGALDQHQRTVAFAGTPAYMAPEVLAGAPAGPSTDQFSFCVSLWEGLYRQRPFKGASLATLVSAIGSGQITSPSEAGSSGNKIPAWLHDVIARGLSADPEARWPSMRQLLDALEAGDPKVKLRRGVTFVGALLGVAGVVGVVQAREASARRDKVADCEALAQSLDWDESRADAVYEHILSTGAEDAKSIATEASETLTRFADNWRDARVETCMSREVEGVLEPELATKMVNCLEQRRTVFDATVQTFLEIDAGMVTRVTRTMQEFDNLDACREEEKLAHIPELPEDPKQRERVQALELTMARTVVDEHVGTYAHGLEVSRDALATATEVDYLPTLAKAKYRVAVFLEKQGKYKEAVDMWAASFHDAAVVGFDQLAADAAAALSFTEGYQLARYDTGIRWSQLAGIYGERLGELDGLREGRRLDVMAVLLEMKGELEESAETHERSLAMRRAAAGDKHSSIGYGLLNYAFVLEKLGEPERARDNVLEALEIFELHFGRKNPTTASVMLTLANMQRKVEAYAEAAALYAEIESVWAESLPPEHPDFGDLSNSVGNLLRDQGDFEGAAQRHRKALEIHEKAHAPEHPDIAWTRIQLAEVLMELERRGEARPLFEAALATLEGADNADMRGRSRYGLARIAMAAGDRERARRGFAEAKAEFERAEGQHEKWIRRCDEGLAASGATTPLPASAATP